MSRKHEEYLQSVCGSRQAKGFLKRPSAEKRWGIAHLEQKPAKNSDGAANRAQRFERTSIQTGSC